MKPKVLIAGAIAALVVLCVAGLAYALIPQGAISQTDDSKPGTCLVACVVVNQNSSGLGGIPVTLHVMGHGPRDDGIRELYSQTNVTTAEAPFRGLALFGNVTIPKGTEYAYLDANATLANGASVYGRSADSPMNAGKGVKGWIVLPVPTQPLPTPVPA